MTVEVSKRMVKWMLTLAVLSPFAVAGLGIWYTNSELARQQHQSDQRWCKLFSLSIDPNAAPPTTQRGKDQVFEFTKLYRSLGCETK